MQGGSLSLDVSRLSDSDTQGDGARFRAQAAKETFRDTARSRPATGRPKTAGGRKNLESELEKVKKELDTYKIYLGQDAAKGPKKLQEENHKLEVELKSKTSKLKEKETQLKTLETEKEKLTSECISYSKSIKRMTSEVEDTRARMIMINNEKTDLEEECNSLKNEKNTLESKINVVEKEMNAIIEEKQKLEKDVEELQIVAENSVPKNSVQGIEAEMEGLRSALTSLSMYISTIASGNSTSQVQVVAKQLTGLLDEKQSAAQQECALNAIYNMADDEKNRQIFVKTEGLVLSVEGLTDSEKRYVREAAKRTLAKLKTAQKLGKHGRGLDIPCEYFLLCKRFFKTLGLQETFFDFLFNCCYCNDCMTTRGDPLYIMQGNPAKDYGLPVGWCRFALRVNDAHADSHNIWPDWHVAFHGTKAEHVNGIINTGHLVRPGETVIGGNVVGNRPNHARTQEMYLSPSIRYAGLDSYATMEPFKDPETGKLYSMRVAFQIRIKPGSYKIQGQSQGLTTQLDPRYSNDELHWITVEYGSTQLYGLLIKCDD